MIPELLSCVLLLSLAPAPEPLTLQAGGGPVRVGQPVRLTLSGAGSGSLEWEFPDFGAELDTFLFLSGERAGDAVWYEVMPTVSGTQTLPAFALRVRGATGADSVRMTAPLALAVGAALRSGEGPELMDELELERFDRSGWFWLLLLLLILFGWVALWRLRRRRTVPQTRGRREMQEIKIEDPQVLALAELEQLRLRGQPVGEAARLLLADLADVLRRYLCASVDADWMFKSLEELEAQLAGLDRESGNGLPGELLREAELAKFAGRIPETSGVSRLLERSGDWVRSRANQAAGGVR